MKFENSLVMLSALLAALGLRLKKWLKRPRKLSVNYQHGKDISKIEVITSNLETDDLTSKQCPEHSSDQRSE